MGRQTGEKPLCYGTVMWLRNACVRVTERGQGGESLRWVWNGSVLEGPYWDPFTFTVTKLVARSKSLYPLGSQFPYVIFKNPYVRLTTE